MPNNNEQQYQPLTFDAIRIGLHKAGDDQLQNIKA